MTTFTRKAYIFQIFPYVVLRSITVLYPWPYRYRQNQGQRLMRANISIMVSLFGNFQREHEGGYDLKFDDPPDDLVCLVCHMVARDARQVECCGKVFCKYCIEEVNSRLGHCPNCRKKSPNIFTDHHTDRQVKQLKVTCDNEEKGCQWTGTLGDYKKHKGACDFVEIACSNSCSEMIFQGFIREHLETACQLRLVECEICHQKITYKDVKDHPEVCPSVEIICPNDGCSTNIFRGQLSAHLNICPQQQIECPYHEVGCSVQILRKDLQEHLQGSIDYHSKVARETVILLRKEVEEQQQCTRVPPLTFRVKGYSKFAEKEQWTTNFFTHKSGYKMELSIYPRGNTENNKDYIAVYFNILPGPKDEELAWPVDLSITVDLLNQCSDDQHHS